MLDWLSVSCLNVVFRLALHLLGGHSDCQFKMPIRLMWNEFFVVVERFHNGCFKFVVSILKLSMCFNFVVLIANAHGLDVCAVKWPDLLMVDCCAMLSFMHARVATFAFSFEVECHNICFCIPNACSTSTWNWMTLVMLNCFLQHVCLH